MCEALATTVPGIRTSAAFTAGLLSVIDALFGRPMAELMAGVPVAEDIAVALTDGAGPLGALLAAVKAYERADVPALLASGVAVDYAAAAYPSALAWAADTRSTLAGA